MATKVFSAVSEDTLHEILDHEQIEYKGDDKRGVLVKYLNRTIESIGVELLAQSLKQADLAAFFDALELKTGANTWGVENSKTKVVMQRRIQEKINESGAQKYLNANSDNLPTEVLSKMYQALTGLEADSKATKKELINSICDWIEFSGLEVFFSRFEVPFLQTVCSELKLKTPTNSKAKLVRAIALQENAKPTEPRPEREVKISKEKPDIEDGISYDDLMNWYLLSELTEYCREQDLKVSGTKHKVCERILAYLGGDKENTLKGTVKKSKRPKSEETKKRERKAAQKAKEEKEGKKSPAKKAVKKSSKSKKSDDEVEEKEEKEEKTEEKEGKKSPAKKSVKKSSKSKNSEDEVEEKEEKEEKQEEKASEKEKSVEKSPKGEKKSKSGSKKNKKEDDE